MLTVSIALYEQAQCCSPMTPEMQVWEVNFLSGGHTGRHYMRLPATSSVAHLSSIMLR